MSPVSVVAIAATVITAVGLAFAPLTIDEGWFLQVCRRVRRGERLYEEVFFGAGPVAVWIGALAFRFSRPQGLVLRALSLLYMVVAATTATWTVQAAGVGWAASTSTGLLVAALTGRGVRSHYGLVSTIGILAAAGSILVSQWLLAGLLLGIAAVSKYSTGALATLVLVPAVFWSGGLAGTAQVGLGIALVVAVVGAVLGVRGLHWFLERAVRNKGIYLDHGTIGLGPGLRALWLGGGPATSRLLSILAYLSVPVAIAATATSIVANPRPVMAVAVGLAVLAALSWFPRADAAHAAASAALAVTALGIATMSLDTTSSGLPMVVAATGVAVLSVASSVISTPHNPRHDLPSFRWVPVPRSGRPWPDRTQDLIERAGRDVFLVRPDAALVYASGGIRNRTPFDYPFTTTFGKTGQAEVIGAIRSGTVSHVCIGPPIPQDFEPRELLEFVEAEMTQIATCDAGTLWALRSDRAPS
jgi:hypothetical protein